MRLRRPYDWERDLMRVITRIILFLVFLWIALSIAVMTFASFVVAVVQVGLWLLQGLGF